MGQYYIPCLLDKSKKKVIAWVNSHDYDSGIKLMEHSYINNNFVRTVEKLLSHGGEWYKQPIVWAGDYADEEPDGITLYAQCEQPDEDDETIKGNKIRPDVIPKDEVLGQYIVNHSKKLYVDKDKVQDIPGDEGWKIHPLPLLTCEGNGRGNGDFRGEHPLIGSWSRDVISIEKKKPAGYEEIIFDLVEN